MKNNVACVNTGLGFHGEIEVMLTDRKTGEIVRRDTIANSLTDPFINYSLMTALSAGDLGKTTRALTIADAQTIGTTVAGTWGIYCLNDTINVTPETVIPPYVDGTDIAMDDSKVVFWADNGNTVETGKRMVTVDSHCGFGTSVAPPFKYSLEYVKNFGEGTVKSVCIGRAATASTTGLVGSFGEQFKIADWAAGTAGIYLIEHLADRSIIYTRNGNYIYRKDLVAKDVVVTSNTNAANAVTTYSGNLVVNGYIVSATVNGEGNTGIEATLTWTSLTDGSATAVTVTLMEEDVSDVAALGASPILYVDPTEGELVLLCSIADNEDGTIVTAVCKLPLADVGKSEVSEPAIIMTTLPFVLGHGNIKTQGFITPSSSRQVWLPIVKRAKGGNTFTSCITTGYQPGAIFTLQENGDYDFVKDYIVCHANELFIPAINEQGVSRIRANTLNLYYGYVGHVVSGANLPSAYTKEQGLAFTIRYTYTVGHGE
jgi:hypothetical protein